MIVFGPPDACPLQVLQVISTVALTANLTSVLLHDFNAGSLAQVGHEFQVANINNRTERTDFYNLPQYIIYERLDIEDFENAFILKDEQTASVHADLAYEYYGLFHNDTRVEDLVPGKSIDPDDPHDPQRAALHSKPGLGQENSPPEPQG
ncbi:MAG: hypothetical protein Q9219_003300 [cf. Caloplaca sp. 3 TL-2023]